MPDAPATDRPVPPSTDDELRALVTRLSRPNKAGGHVIERSALLASGADFTAAMAWITAHDGQPEARAEVTPGGGLHDSRLKRGGSAATLQPLRFVLPAGALTA